MIPGEMVGTDSTKKNEPVRRQEEDNKIEGSIENKFKFRMSVHCFP